MATTKLAVWPGTDEQLRLLMRAVAHNCTCEKATILKPNPSKCGVCKMLLDEPTLNHFAFVGKRAKQYWFNEFLT